MITTTEAKTKVCPLMDGSSCVAEECMAWQPNIISGSGYCAQFAIPTRIIEAIAKKQPERE